MLARKAEGYDLLRVGGVRWLVLWKGFPYVFQALTLGALLALLWLSWGWYAPAGVNLKLYAKSHFATLLVWGLWWPAMIWVTVLLGRAWCMICPLELTSNLSERLGRLLGIRQLSLRPWLASGALIVALYAILLFLVAGAQIHRIPAYTAWFLLSLLALSVLAGLLFKDRAFCRGFCPVGELLATYGRGGILVVRADTSEACSSCAGKECVASALRYKGDARSCPSLLNPPKLNHSRDCLICGQCIKACQPDNMRLLLRRLFSAADLRQALASWPTTVFVMVVSGFVAWELCTEWKAAEDAFLAAPRWVSAAVGAGVLGGYVNGLWALAVVPLAGWSVLGLIPWRKLGLAAGLTSAWRRMALPMAVIIAAGQMAKGLAKFVSWAGFLPYTLSEFTGVETAVAVSGKAVATPAAVLPITWVSLVGAGLLVTAFFYALREAKLADRTSSSALLAPKLAVVGLFLFIVLGWGFH